ncbi:MAG: hypothetical protein ACPG4T_10955, partial [Nannocystaceae bacterium]
DPELGPDGRPPVRAAFLCGRLILLLKKAVEQELLASVPSNSIKLAQSCWANRASSHACANVTQTVRRQYVGGA